MRNAIGGAWLYSIVLVFMTIFIAFISISINYSNAFKLKSDMVTKMEQYKGFNATTINELDNLMNKYGYLQKGTCQKPKDSDNTAIKKSIYYYGVDYGNDEPFRYETTNNSVIPARHSYCVYSEMQKGSTEAKDKYFFTVEVFFGFNLPVVGNLFTFRVSGETNAIYYPTNPKFDGSYQ